MEVLVSIIIPCYNSASTAAETFQSVLDQTYQNWEAIIVNDGSPDEIEVLAAEWVAKDSRFNYYKKENGGLGTARNYGIKMSKGEYILPLDSDNKVEVDYLETAIPIFQLDPKIGVVYGNAFFFGEKKGVWNVGEYDEFKLIKSNYIDACAILKKEVLDVIGLYDTNFPYQGIEDWELWLRCIKNKVNFYYLEKIAFHYRVSNSSMIHSFTSEMTEANTKYLYKKHFWFLIQIYIKYRRENKIWLRNIATVLKASISLH